VEHIETRMDSALEEISQGKPVGFEKLEEETSRITGEVAELSRFIRLNYSAFMKVKY
jgi:SPX domain protein involved in polyphosphate accumulation